MTYTLWHCGVLIGETDFEGQREIAPRGHHRRHLVGAFRPTAYGRELLPRLCGILSAGADLKEELARRGLDPDDTPPEALEDVFETTAAGAHIIDIGRVLCDVELRAPTGHVLEVVSMGFLELAELACLSRRLGSDQPVILRDLPPEAPEFLVSVTLRVPANRLCS